MRKKYQFSSIMSLEFRLLKLDIIIQKIIHDSKNQRLLRLSQI